MKKIEQIQCEPKTYRSEDGKDMFVMNAALSMDGLAAKLNEVIRGFNGLYDAVEALSHSIPPKAPTSPTPEEMGYIKLDEDSLRRFHESPEGKELGRRYNQIVRDRTESSISEIAKREQRFQEMMSHFGKAIQMLTAIAHGEAPEGHPDCRKDPRFISGGYSNVSLLAQVAMDELETALAGADELHEPQNKGKENENH